MVLFNTYIRIKNKNIRLSDIILNKGIRNVCIYGAGTIGTILFEEMEDSELNVVCFIDRAAKRFRGDYCGIPVIFPEDTGKIHVDAIIVSPYKRYYEVRSYLKHFTSCATISARDILSASMSEREFVDLSKYLTTIGTRLYLFNRPSIDMIDNMSLREQSLLGQTNHLYTVKKKGFFEDLYKGSGISDVESYLKGYYDNLIPIENNPETEKVFRDTQSPFVNIINGYRYIPDQPDAFKNTVYTFGDCSNHEGDDSRTLGNRIQQLFNETSKGKYKVESYASTMHDISFLIKKIKSLPLKRGDVIIYVSLAFRYHDHNHRFFHDLPNILCFDLMSDFSRPQHLTATLIRTICRRRRLTHPKTLEFLRRRLHPYWIFPFGLPEMNHYATLRGNTTGI